ncbi:hypothetical protein [Streptomyces albidoflavus]|uniref:hypothetical protein n=1 Tax=Streptomyces albidoflavus TaxID=1886 RepID=UPI0033D821F4
MTADRPGLLVAATAVHSRGSRVHASPLTHTPARPDLGLTPWNPLCASTTTIHRAGPDATVDCGTCLAVMRRRNLILGDTLKEQP